MLAGVDSKFPMSMWDHLIEEVIITVKILRQSKVHSHLLAWPNYNRVLDHNETPMEPLGCRFLIHEPVKTRTSSEFHAIEGHYDGPAMHH